MDSRGLLPADQRSERIPDRITLRCSLGISGCAGIFTGILPLSEPGAEKNPEPALLPLGPTDRTRVGHQKDFWFTSPAINPSFT